MSDTKPETMFEKIYNEAQEALDEILGPNEEDGAGQGLVAEIWLIARQRDAALKLVRAVEDWSAGGFSDTLQAAHAAYLVEMDAIKAEIDA